MNLGSDNLQLSFEEGGKTDLSVGSDKQSEDVESVMNQTPPWIMKNGNWVILCVVTISLLLAAFIKFPDIVVGNISISYSNPTVKLIARSSGKIQHFFVDNYQEVLKYDPICLIENRASYKDVFFIKDVLKSLDSNIRYDFEFKNLGLKKNINLGEAQNEFVELLTLLNDYTFFKRDRNYLKRMKTVREQFNYSLSLDTVLMVHDELLSKKLAIEKRKFHMDSSLFINHASAPLDFYNSQLTFLNQMIIGQENSFRRIDNRMSMSRLENEITSLEQDYMQQDDQMKNAILQSIKKLEIAISSWELNYLIRSPLIGKITFFDFWKENQVVNEAEVVAVITPDSNEYICKSKIPIKGAGKIKAGQKVIIKLAAYPFNEYGILSGKVEKISEIPLDNFYSMDVSLTNGLMTNGKISIPPNSLLEGQVEVLTNNKNILQRIFDRLLTINKYN